MPWLSPSVKERQSCQIRLWTKIVQPFTIYYPYPIFVHILGTCALISIIAIFLQRILPTHETPSHPSAGVNPPVHGEMAGLKKRTKENGHVMLYHLHVHQGPPLFPIFCPFLCWLQRHHLATQGSIILILFLYYKIICKVILRKII